MTEDPKEILMQILIIKQRKLDRMEMLASDQIETQDDLDDRKIDFLETKLRLLQFGKDSQK